MLSKNTGLSVILKLYIICFAIIASLDPAPVLQGPWQVPSCENSRIVKEKNLQITVASGSTSDNIHCMCPLQPVS